MGLSSEEPSRKAGIMEWLNYHHLLYCWTVAKHGSEGRAAEELRLAHHALGEITGETASEDMIEQIFSGFCIGK